MEKNPVLIQTALQTALHAENVEAIELALEGNQRVLVRSKAMPMFAFMVWSEHRSGTFSWLGLDIPKDSKGMADYQVVCACCGTQVYGITKPESLKDNDAEGWKQFKTEHGKTFKLVLTETCKRYGITTVFMRRASAWDNQYGPIDGVRFAEAREFQKVMLELYSSKVVEEHTKFISRSTSRGMFE